MVIFQPVTTLFTVSSSKKTAMISSLPFVSYLQNLTYIKLLTITVLAC